MARMKKPSNESFEQARIRQILESVSNNPSRSEKMSWNRKMDNMVRLLSEIRPIEEQILALVAKKGPIMDKISDLRQDMTIECVHPYEYLIYKEDHVLCKFCNKRISIPNEYK